MKIEESLGVVTDNGKQWDLLCDTIVEYIYDIQNGLNSNPFNEDQKTIYMNNIISFYRYKHGKIDSNLIPEWIGDFEIQINENLQSKGQFNKSSAILKDNKLEFSIYVQDYLGKNPDEFQVTLEHEFRHAYTTWIEKTKNISIHKKQDRDLYNAGNKGFHGEKYDKDYSMISDFGVDYIVMDNNIYSDPIKLEQSILKSFYYIDIDEINSFIQEFAADIKNQINKKYKNVVKDDLKKFEELKKIDFNILTNEQKWKSNILNSMRVTPYNSVFFRIYKSYIDFWKNIKNVDEDLAEDVLLDIRKPVKTYLKIDQTKKLIKYDGDGLMVLNKIAKKQLPVFQRVILKMNHIYARLIMVAYDEFKQDKVIDNEINNSEFEEDLIKIIK